MWEKCDVQNKTCGNELVNILQVFHSTLVFIVTLHHYRPAKWPPPLLRLLYLPYYHHYYYGYCIYPTTTTTITAHSIVILPLLYHFHHDLNHPCPNNTINSITTAIPTSTISLRPTITETNAATNITASTTVLPFPLLPTPPQRLSSPSLKCHQHFCADN